MESYLDANQFAEAAEVYRQMNTLGYVSREKLGSSLVEVGADAEYYWSETDFGNNNSPYVKTAFDLYTEAAGLGCAQAYAKLAYCYDYGHYVSQDPAQACHWWTQMANTGDGLLTAIKVMEVICETKMPLSELAAGMTMYPQKLKNVVVTDKDETLECEAVKAMVAQVEDELGDEGRVVLRKSGTEPVLRVMVEAGSHELCEEKLEKIIAAMKAAGKLIKVK